MYHTVLIVIGLFYCLTGHGQKWMDADGQLNYKGSVRERLESSDFRERSQAVNNLQRKPGDVFQKSSQVMYHLDSIVESSWSEQKQSMINKGLYRVDFTSNEQEVVQEHFAWDTLYSRWEIKNQNYFRYNEEGELWQTEFQEVVILDYRLYVRTDYEYENGNLRLETHTDRIDEQETWSKVEQIEYKYDSLNRMTRALIRNWDPFEEWWITYLIVKYEYNENGTLSNISYNDYVQGESTMDLLSEWRFAYDDNKRLIEAVEWIPGWEENQFVPDRKQAYAYSESEKPDSETSYKWSYDSGGWEPLMKLIHFNESAGPRMYQVQSQSYSSQWQNQDLTSFYSDEQFAPEQVENSTFLEMYLPFFTFHDKVCDNVEQSEWNGADWDVNTTLDYYFTMNPAVSVRDLNRPSVRVYPNPARDYLHVSEADVNVCLFDLHGKVVLQEEMPVAGRVDISQVPAGVYLVQLIQDAELVFGGKVVVVR